MYRVVYHSKTRLVKNYKKRRDHLFNDNKLIGISQFLNYNKSHPCLPCWLLARLLVVGLLAAKTAAAAEAAGTVGNGIDVDGIELKRESS